MYGYGEGESFDNANVLSVDNISMISAASLDNGCYRNTNNEVFEPETEGVGHKRFQYQELCEQIGFLYPGWCGPEHERYQSATHTYLYDENISHPGAYVYGNPEDLRPDYISRLMMNNEMNNTSYPIHAEKNIHEGRTNRIQKGAKRGEKNTKVKVLNPIICRKGKYFRREDVKNYMRSVLLEKRKEPHIHTRIPKFPEHFTGKLPNDLELVIKGNVENMPYKDAFVTFREEDNSIIFDMRN